MHKTDTQFLREADCFFPAPREALAQDVHNTLPAGNFIVSLSPKGFYLRRVDDFEMPSEFYGNINRYSDRIFSTFISRNLSTGVFLEGEKGSGKTLLAKVLSQKIARELKAPTLIVNSKFSGDGFNKFIQDIKQPCMILFDEFEKVFDETEDQNALLTLLDGAFPTKKLFVLTCNDRFKVNNHMKNRPSRLFYALTFDGLTDAFVREYAAKNLKKELHCHISQVVSIAQSVHKFNFDMVKCLVEEMNRYNESPKQAVEMLNIKPDSGFEENYKLTYFDPEGVEVPNEELEETTWLGDLQRKGFHVHNYRTFKKVGKKRQVILPLLAMESHYAKYDKEEKTFNFVLDNKYSLVMRKIPKVGSLIDISYEKLL